MPTSNPFDHVEPHCRLPDATRAAFWAACERVLVNPQDFAEAATWLDDKYSEEFLRAECERQSRASLLQRLEHLRKESPTRRRRRATRLGHSLKDLKQERI